MKWKSFKIQVAASAIAGTTVLTCLSVLAHVCTGNSPLNQFLIDVWTLNHALVVDSMVETQKTCGIFFFFNLMKK